MLKQEYLRQIRELNQRFVDTNNRHEQVFSVSTVLNGNKVKNESLVECDDELMYLHLVSVMVMLKNMDFDMWDEVETAMKQISESVCSCGSCL